MLLFNKGDVCEVTFGFFSIKWDHSLSLTLTQSYECLNLTIKNFNNTGVANLDAELQDRIFRQKKKLYVVDQIFWQKQMFPVYM